MRRLIVFIALVLVVGLWAQPVSAQAPAKLALQIAVQTLPLYGTPDLGTKAIATLPGNLRLLWDGTAQNAGGRKWLPVAVGGSSGFISPNANDVFLIDPRRTTADMNRGVRARTTAALNLYLNADLISGSVRQLPQGTAFTVVGGPAVTDLFTWWQIKTDDNAVGWLPDTLATFQVIQPLKVYNYPVCAGYDLGAYGATGWDPIVKQFPNLIPAPEQIACLLSVNFKGDGTPFVVVLARVEGVSAFAPYDSLRIFGVGANGDWLRLYEFKSNVGERTSILEVVALDGKPALLWGVVNQGTGSFFSAKMFRYTTITGFQQILAADGWYQGAALVSADTVTLLQSDYKANEPNCCHTEYQRTILAWQNGQFITVGSDKIANPAFLQGVPQP
ncbi:MAG TPA: SH3 domain-containing protein [Aggregatilineales bacterium]|nr:SH3 domain-containing protein [Aggregatilineales bacterium]